MTNKKNNLTIAYLDTQNVQNPVSTFRVSGVYNGIRVNEVVALTPIEVAKATKQPVDVLNFLTEIKRMQEDSEKSPCRPLLVAKAYERAESTYKKLQTYKLMLALSQKDKRKHKQTVSVYDRKGRVTQYGADGRAVSTLHKGKIV